MGGQDVQAASRGLEIMRLNELHRDVVLRCCHLTPEQHRFLQRKTYSIQAICEFPFRFSKMKQEDFMKKVYKRDWEDIELFETDIGTVINATEGKID